MKLATLCYLRKDGKTLMLHRQKGNKDAHKDKWNGVGGKFDEGETPEDCVIREVLEETGLSIKNPLLKGRILFPAFDKQPEDWHVYVFTADDIEGDLLSKSNEGTLEWVEDSEILNLNLWAGDKIFLGWLNNKGFFSAKFQYDSEKLVYHTVTFYK
jgi:8-oxo-dGTP diphosphatase